MHTPLVETLTRHLTVLALLGAAAAVTKAQSTPTFTNLYSFTGGSDRGLPNGPLALGRDGNLYGTTNLGNNSPGTVFKITPAGAFASIYQFIGTSDGVGPTSLTLGTDGNFYGATTGQLTNSSGNVFRVTPTGTYTLLNRSTNPSSNGPLTSVLPGSDGNLYGTTASGGTTNTNGTVFQLTAAGTLTVLHSFAGGTDGSNPIAQLTQGSDGNFYGTTVGGGTNNDGTLFELTPQGTLTTLHQFAGGTDGHGPSAKLVRASDGSLYGTAPTGGANGRGTVFKLDTAGRFTTLYAFAGGSDGQTPTAGLILASDGNLYGTTSTGGTDGGGTVFQLTPAGALTTVYSFAGSGVGPGALVETSDGTLYGTTRTGGNNSQGSIYKLTIPLPPTFFNGEVAVGNGVEYLAFPNNGNVFGYYSFLSDPRYVYHFDLGYEYVADAADGANGVFLYDFASSTFFYTSPSFPFPYLYDFSLNAFLYYYPDPNNPGRYNTNGTRYFYNFKTGQIITK